MQRSAALKVVDLKQELVNPSGFDMETVIKEQGMWICKEAHCNGCHYLRNLRCLERFGLLKGDPEYDEAYRDVIHADPGDGDAVVASQPVDVRLNGMLEVYEKPYYTDKQKRRKSNRERREEKRQARRGRGKK